MNIPTTCLNGRPVGLRTRSVCYVWPGPKYRNGYGRLVVVRGGKDNNMLAHRVVYEGVFGKIPEGLTIDHLCRNRACVNPKHMRVVSQRENTLAGNSPSAINARKTECHRGHALSGYNLMLPKYGGRKCRKCHNLMRNLKSAERKARRNALSQEAQMGFKA